MQNPMLLYILVHLYPSHGRSSAEYFVTCTLSRCQISVSGVINHWCASGLCQNIRIPCNFHLYIQFTLDTQNSLYNILDLIDINWKNEKEENCGMEES